MEIRRIESRPIKECHAVILMNACSSFQIQKKNRTRQGGQNCVSLRECHDLQDSCEFLTPLNEPMELLLLSLMS